MNLILLNDWMARRAANCRELANTRIAVGEEMEADRWNEMSAVIEKWQEEIKELIKPTTPYDKT